MDSSVPGSSGVKRSNRKQKANVKMKVQEYSTEFRNMVRWFDCHVQTIQEFKHLIKDKLEEFEANRSIGWDTQLSKSSSITETVIKCCDKVSVDLESVKGRPLKDLARMLESGALPYELDLPTENVTVINLIAKNFCMVNLKQDDKETCIWSTIAYCLDTLPNEEFTGSSLFFYAFSSFLKCHTSSDADLMKFLQMKWVDLELLLLSHFVHLLHCDLYIYRHIGAQECFLLNQGVTIEKVLNREVEVVPGTVDLILLKCDTSDSSLPPMMFGNVNNSIFPFVVHSANEKVDLASLLTHKIIATNMDNRENTVCHMGREKLCSNSILSNQFSLNTNSTDDFETGTVCGRQVIMPHCIPVEFEEMNAARLGEKYSHLLNRFGAMVFRTKNFETVAPGFKMPSQSEKMEFDIQRVTKVDGTGIYTVFTDGSMKLSSDEAAAHSHHKFEKMSSNDSFDEFLVTVKTDARKQLPKPKTARKSKPENEQKYLYAKGDKVPFIFEWSKHADKLLNKYTSTLQAVNKHYQIEGVTSHHYYVSVGNSVFRVHVENRGLNACNYLLVGVKFWAVLPKREYPRFLLWLELQLKEKKDVYFTGCPNWLQHKILFIDITTVPEEFNLTFIAQEAGDLVVLDNYAIHWGWNVEFNVAISYNWSNNPHWDKVQHFMPVCNLEDANCSAPVFSMENLTLLRQTDGLVSNSSIPVNHISDPNFNYFTSHYKPPYLNHKVSSHNHCSPPAPSQLQSSCVTTDSLLHEDSDEDLDETVESTTVNTKMSHEKSVVVESQGSGEVNDDLDVGVENIDPDEFNTEEQVQTDDTEGDKHKKKKKRKKNKKQKHKAKNDSDETSDEEPRHKKKKRRKKEYVQNFSNSSSDYSSDDSVNTMIKKKKISIECKFCHRALHSDKSMRNHFTYTPACKQKKEETKLSVAEYWNEQKEIKRRELKKKRKKKRKEREIRRQEKLNRRN